MNPYYKETCPLCQKELVNTHNVSSYAGTVNLYDCPIGHYTLSENADSGEPILARFFIPLFHLMYSPEETVIYLREPPNSTKYRYVCVLPGYFPLQWDNLDYSAQRLKNLLIFS